jgi:hypothetical protein
MSIAVGAHCMRDNGCLDIPALTGCTKQPEKTGIIEHVQHNRCRQALRSVLEEAKHQRREKYQCCPQGCMVYKMQHRKQNTCQQVCDTQWTDRVTADQVVQQFLHYSPEYDLLDNRVEQYRQQKLPGFKQWPVPLNDGSLNEIQGKPDQQTCQQRRIKQWV